MHNSWLENSVHPSVNTHFPSPKWPTPIIKITVGNCIPTNKICWNIPFRSLSLCCDNTVFVFWLGLGASPLVRLVQYLKIPVLVTTTTAGYCYDVALTLSSGVTLTNVGTTLGNHGLGKKAPHSVTLTKSQSSVSVLNKCIAVTPSPSK